MPWFDREKTVALTQRLERHTTNACPVCGEGLVAFVPREEAEILLSMRKADTGEVLQGFLFDMVMCSQCGYTRLHHHGALTEWLDTLDGAGKRGDNE